MSSTNLDVIVIGGGLAGLVGATLLARDGHRVGLWERRARLGGRADSLQTSGYSLNLGPHAIAMRGPGTHVLRELGIDLPGRNPLSRPPSFFRDGALVPARRRRGGPGLAPLLRALGTLGRQAATGEPEGVATAGEWLDGLSHDARTLSALRAFGRLTLYADAADEAAADYLAEAVRGGTVRYLDGGWAGLVERLRLAAVRAGVEITSDVARGVVAEHGEVRGVATDAGLVAADAVLLAAGGPRDAAELLPADAGGQLRQVARTARPARMACLDVALGGTVVPGTVALGLDEPTYLSVQSAWSDIAPAGVGGVVQVARFLPLGEAAPPRTRADLEAVLTRVVPDWRDRVVHARFLPALTVTHQLPTSMQGGIRARHGVTVEGVRGVALAGDWVGQRGTLAQAAIASAAEAAGVLATQLQRRRTEQAV